MTNQIHSYLLKSWESPFHSEIELKAKKPPVVLYTAGGDDLPSKIMRVIKKVLSWIFFPLAIHNFCHKAVKSPFILSSPLKGRNDVVRFIEDWDLNTFLMSTFWFSVYAMSPLSQVRLKGWIKERSPVSRDRSQDRYWDCKRLGVGVDGEVVDSFFLRQKSVKSFDRIMLYTCSEDELAEGKLHDVELLGMAKKLKAHVVVWNYNGIGASSGSCSQSSMVKSYKAMLRFVEDQEGLGAKEVISYGHSIGAAVQLEALKNYRHEEGVKFTSVARSPFSNLSQALACRYGNLVALAKRACGWHFDNQKALSQVKDPCLVVQTAVPSKGNYSPITDAAQVVPDGILEDTDATLAKSLLDQDAVTDRVKLVGVREFHDEPLPSRVQDQLVADIEKQLHQK